MKNIFWKISFREEIEKLTEELTELKKKVQDNKFIFANIQAHIGSYLDIAFLSEEEKKVLVDAEEEMVKEVIEGVEEIKEDDTKSGMDWVYAKPQLQLTPINQIRIQFMKKKCFSKIPK